MGMKEYKGAVSKVTDTPFGYTLSLLRGKWKLVILYLLSEEPHIRFNELHRQVGNITYKMLSDQLKELEADGLVIRNEYAQVPPKVEYSLSERGKSLMPVLDAMCNWGIRNNPKYENAAECTRG
ncbi:MAG: helix-turn-helix transcriptional regulator [Defluviitaleaceae bacterium]|nr:helix-turn-helix transcriptional regulator [Defluviitaleaceae bacterium]